MEKEEDEGDVSAAGADALPRYLLGTDESIGSHEKEKEKEKKDAEYRRRMQVLKRHPTQLEEDAEEEDPSGWSSASGRLHYWHRSSRRSVWHLPWGLREEKEGEEEEEEEEEEASSSNLFSLLASSSPAVAYAGLVLLVPFLRSFPFVWRQAQAAKLHGWYGQDGQFHCSPSFPVVRPKMRCIMAGMVRSTVMSVLGRFAGDNAPLAVFSSCSTNP